MYLTQTSSTFNPSRICDTFIVLLVAKSVQVEVMTKVSTNYVVADQWCLTEM